MVRFWTLPPGPPPPRRCERMAVEGERGSGRTRERGGMPNVDEKISRAGFLKLGVLGISATALAFAAGCGGEEDDDDEGEDDD